VNYIIYGANSTIGFTVLRRGVGAGYPQHHPMSGEECSRGGIVELMAIVALNNFDGTAKLCGDQRKKIDQVEKVPNLTREGKFHIKWERSSIMSR
jgi:hypothetical protein